MHATCQTSKKVVALLLVCFSDFDFPAGNVFEEIENNFDGLFETQVREALIVKIRELIKSEVHNTVEINYEVICCN